MTDDTWDGRAEALWARFDSYAPDDFVAAMESLVAELPAGDPRGPFELGSAHDSVGHEARAERFYRTALAAGLDGPPRRRALIQLASTLRNLGRAAEGAELLEAELGSGRSDELDDAVTAFLALILTDLGREREAAGLALAALAPHLPRYQRSLTNYAHTLTP